MPEVPETMVVVVVVVLLLLLTLVPVLGSYMASVVDELDVSIGRAKAP